MPGCAWVWKRRDAPAVGRGAPFVLSLLVHLGLVAAWMLIPRDTLPPPPDQITVQLVGDGEASAARPDGAGGRSSPPPAPAASAAPGAVTAPPLPVPVPQTKEEHPTRPEHRRATGRTPRTKPAVQLELASPSPSPLSLRADDRAPTGGTGPSANGATKDGGGDGPGASGPGDGGGRPDLPPPDMGPYLATVRRMVQAALVYPPSARRLGLSGAVDVRFAIEADGTIDLKSLRVTGGSPDSLLQEGALDTIRQLAIVPPPPIGTVTVDLAVGFALQPRR